MPSCLPYRNCIIIGCGPHYQKRYHDVLEKSAIDIALCVDLEDKNEDIKNFFQKKRLKPRKMLFLKEHYRNLISPDDIHREISSKVDISKVDAVLLCTEPKVRKPYVLWALKNRLAVFMDKPPCAFVDVNGPDSLLSDFEEMVTETQRVHVPVVVSCERRAHLGYQWLKNYLSHFIEDERAPITSIDIHFANGHWVTPKEYAEQENHPFKYGYGLLLHSGYHYIDVLTSLLALNKEQDCEFLLKFLKVNPNEQLHQLQQLYSPAINACALKNGGETDFFLIGQAMEKGWPKVQFSLKLVNTSLSKRASPAPALDAPWRMRQEQVIIHLGYFASVHLSSNPLKKLDPQNHPHEDFTITIMHSPLLPKREPVIKMDHHSFAQMYPEMREIDSLNQYAREWQLREFLQGRDGNSPLQSHRQTVQILDMIYSEKRECALNLSQYHMAL